MTEPVDPWEARLAALREPVLPVDPDPAFASALRARLRRALLDRPRTEGAKMTTSTEYATGPVEGDLGYASVWVPDVVRAEAFYASVLGWQYAPGSVENGRQVVNLSGQHIGLWGDREPNTAQPAFAVDDARETVRKVRAAGGTAEDPTQAPYGLSAMCADDQGMAFSVFQSPAVERGPVPDARPSEIVYVTFEVRDSARFRSFFGAVFGWQFSPGRGGGDRWSIDGVRPLAGLAGGSAESTVVPQYLVADIDAAVERVRAAGGTASEPERQPYGISSQCVDDQGTRFYLAQIWYYLQQ